MKHSYYYDDGLLVIVDRKVAPIVNRNRNYTKFNDKQTKNQIGTADDLSV